MGPKLYETIREFAERTGLTYSAVRKLCLQGKLPFVPIGRRKMIYIGPALEALEKMTVRNNA